MKTARLVGASLLLVGTSVAAKAAETITYKYDAQGRLIEVKAVSTTAPSSNSTTKYEYDQAHNRRREQITKP